MVGTILYITLFHLPRTYLKGWCLLLIVSGWYFPGQNTLERLSAKPIVFFSRPPHIRGQLVQKIGTIATKRIVKITKDHALRL